MIKHRQAGDNHLDPAVIAQPCVKPGGCWTSRGTAAFRQLSGQLILSGNDWVDPYQDFKLAKPGTRHVEVGPLARKTLVVGNILNVGRLNVTSASSAGKLVIDSNVDDSTPEGLAPGGSEDRAAALAFKERMDALVSALTALPSESEEAATVRAAIATLASSSIKSDDEDSGTRAPPKRPNILFINVE